eukprot:2492261-Alexandrium_andersonii.AAC.1
MVCPSGTAPLPCQNAGPALLCCATNIATWAHHASAFLEQARSAGAGLALLAETAVGRHSRPGFEALAHRAGWQVVAPPWASSV